jgi:hypothetical protein
MDPELELKNRLPLRLEQAGFEFLHPAWPEACSSLVERVAA